jgi:hypothetical protein
LFALADLGAHPVKGFGKRVRAWRVLGDSPVESRFEALHGQRLTPFVGREHEIGLLLERFERAKDGEGQVVLLSGEPGIGKSRTVRALRERLRGEHYLVLSNFCSPFHVNSALHPIIDQIERAAGFERDDPSETKLHKLEVLLARAVDNVEQVAPLIAALLTIPTGERYAPLNLTPEAQKRRTFEALVDQLAGLASKQPVLAVYEDVHWIDPTSRDLLEYAALLHDIGHAVDHDRHQRHSYYLITHGDLTGFSADEIEVIASLARYHKGGRPKESHENWRRLDPYLRAVVEKLAAILRIADGLDRSHRQVVTGVSCRVRPRKFELEAAARADCEPELDAARKKANLFERVFDRSIAVRAVPAGLAEEVHQKDLEILSAEALWN